MNTNDVYHMINHIIPGAVLRPNEIRISFFLHSYRFPVFTYARKTFTKIIN